jgi:hypothetical protein
MMPLLPATHPVCGSTKYTDSRVFATPVDRRVQSTGVGVGVAVDVGVGVSVGVAVGVLVGVGVGV